MDAFTPSLRAKLRPAREPELTPLQEIELLAWDKARKQLGTYKTKARELGVSVSLLNSALIRLRAREIK